MPSKENEKIVQEEIRKESFELRARASWQVENPAWKTREDSRKDKKREKTQQRKTRKRREKEGRKLWRKGTRKKEKEHWKKS